MKSNGDKLNNWFCYAVYDSREILQNCVYDTFSDENILCAKIFPVLETEKKTWAKHEISEKEN